MRKAGANPFMQYIHIHVPKTAGTSLRDMVRNVHGFRLLEIDNSFHAQSICLLKKRRMYVSTIYNALHGHITFDESCRLFGPKNFYTILRDPKERVESLARHIASKSNHYMNSSRFTNPQEVLDFYGAEPKSNCFFYEYFHYLLPGGGVGVLSKVDVKESASQICENFSGLLTLGEFSRLGKTPKLNISQPYDSALRIPTAMLEAVELEEWLISEIIRQRPLDRIASFVKLLESRSRFRVPRSIANVLNPVRVRSEIR